MITYMQDGHPPYKPTVPRFVVKCNENLFRGVLLYQK